MHPAHPDAFPATRHSLVRAVASPDVRVRARAYDAIVRSYWRPVYAYIRLRWRRDPADAQDLTQEFFARAFEKAYLARYNPAKARFRTFVRTCLDGFLANERKAAARLKRGGGSSLESLDFDGMDADFIRHARPMDSDPEVWFHREWIRTLFADAVDALRMRCDRDGRAVPFALFSRYDLDDAEPWERPTYAALAREYGVAVSDVTNHLAWARRTFREIVLDSLRALCATDEEFRAEARDLLGISPP